MTPRVRKLGYLNGKPILATIRVGGKSGYKLVYWLCTLAVRRYKKVIHIFKLFGRAYCNFFWFVVEWCCTKRNSFGGGFILNYKERRDWLIGGEFPHSRNAHPQKDLFCRQLLGDRDRRKRERQLYCLMNSEVWGISQQCRWEVGGAWVIVWSSVRDRSLTVISELLLKTGKVYRLYYTQVSAKR